MESLEKQIQAVLENRQAPYASNDYRVYPRSIHRYGNTLFYLTNIDNERFLIVSGNEHLSLFNGDVFFVNNKPSKKCCLTPHNAQSIMSLFPFTRPVSHKEAPFTMGLGDRLGLASPGHIQAVKFTNVFPVLAQQSMRELKLTKRTYKDVLASAVFAVFQEDWQSGYGADGDHLKTADEIIYALDCGYTMITLDCSDYIDNVIVSDDIDSHYMELPSAVRYYYEEAYLHKTFKIGDCSIAVTPASLKLFILIYHKAIDYMVQTFDDILKDYPRTIDFEISVDETLYPTSPESHFIIASELIKRGVKFVSLAPRFIGEFQKGIDYIGEPESFKADFIIHAMIAKHLGYKLSIHSGSDKFSIFNIIGKYTDLNVHVKTAGTNWLEAIRIIASRAPALYRRMHAFALEHFEEAKAYYHVSADPSKLAPLDEVTDEKLTGYLDIPDARQLLHITYGLILTAELPDGTPLLKDEIYQTLNQYEEEYYDALRKHIGRHIESIMSGR